PPHRSAPSRTRCGDRWPGRCSCRPRGDAVDAPHDGLPEPLHAKDAAVQALDERPAEITLEERWRALAAPLLITARRERPVRTTALTAASASSSYHGADHTAPERRAPEI